MSAAKFDVLIIGAGHAGVQTAVTLLEKSFPGSIALLSNENTLPYERPPLTKAVLKGIRKEDELLIRPASFWKDSGVQLFLDEQVVQLDPQEHTATTHKGTKYHYGTLVWAAGASPFRPPVPGIDLPAVHELRSLADTVKFRDSISSGTRVVVIGGGYVGLEAASACTSLGATVTVIEALPSLLSRVTGQHVSGHILRTHQAAGVSIELESQLTHITETDDETVVVSLSDGRELTAEVVLMSVGIRPNISVLAEAGATCGNGVEIDSTGLTSLPDVYAAGDCTSFPIPGGRRRLESLQNAVEQGKLIAKALTGTPGNYSVIPFFWSHQYNLQVKTVGLFAGYDQTILRKGANEESFSVIYLQGGRVCAVDTINSMKDYVDARTMVGQLIDVDAAQDQRNRLRDSLLLDDLNEARI